MLGSAAISRSGVRAGGLPMSWFRTATSSGFVLFGLLLSAGVLVALGCVALADAPPVPGWLVVPALCGAVVHLAALVTALVRGVGGSIHQAELRWWRHHSGQSVQLLNVLDSTSRDAR